MSLSGRLAFALATLGALLAQEGRPARAEVRFERHVLADRYYCDGADVGDLDRDGDLDIVAGPFWYEGPDFVTRREFFPARVQDAVKGQSNSMFSYVHDFNADGWPDVLVLGRVHMHPARWFENPRGRPGPWPEHVAFDRVRGESPPFVDVDGDGRPELVCHWEGRWGWIAPDWDRPAEPWAFHPITEPGEYDQFYHGTGVGDVDGDGRADLVLNEGWWSQPPRESKQATWTFHPFRLGQRGGAQILLDDVDGDGDRDLISALDAHGWGIAWFEQVRDEGGRITFRRHPIMGDRSEEARFGVAFSQPHALALADLDGDGLRDLVTGKRRWAHGPTGDVEPDAAPVVYWFRLTRRPDGTVRYEPRRIDDASGVGVQIAAEDVDGDGAVDILTASKLGTFLFLNSGIEETSRPGGRDRSPGE